MNLANFLHRAALSFPDRPAISLGKEVVYNYAEMGALAARIAGGVTAGLGIAPRENVALVMKNVPEYWPILFGLWHAGIAAVPINAKLHPREVAWILENAEARACFVTPDLAEGIRPLPAEIKSLKAVIEIGTPEWQKIAGAAPVPFNTDVRGDDLAWLFYTSGTTGRPKGAMLTHRNMVVMSMNYFADVDSISSDDCMIHCAPISHGSGVYGLPHVAAAANQIVPVSGGFDPAETLDLISHWPGASFFFAPTMVHRLINAPELRDADTSNLKTIIYGGGPMYLADLLDAMEKLGPKLAQIYGQGEAPMTITGMNKAMHIDRGHPRHMDHLASAGIVRSDVEVRVFDANDKSLPVGEIGEVVCRGDVVMKGYWRNEKASADALRGGWLHTGDMGAFDADGYLTLKDRSKDMIISGGSNIYPREIEEVLLRHPKVAEVSVVGKPHADWGEEVIAFVVPVAGETVTEAELDQMCLDNIARFKRPKQYRFPGALPKNNYGKVLKTELRKVLSGD